MVLDEILLIMIFATTASLAAYVFAPGEEERALRKRIRELRLDHEDPDALEREVLAEPFSRRVLRPALERAVALLVRITPAGYQQRLQVRLREAGNPYGIGSLLLLKVSMTLLFPAALWLIAGARAGTLPLAAAFLFGWQLPDFMLARRAAARRREIARTLPDAIDLLSVSVEAGIGFDGAVQKVSERFAGPLSAEFAQYLKEVRLGRTREDALRSLAERVELPELKTFVAAVVQADRLGVSLSRVLRVQAEQLRQQRRQRAEEAAMKAPVKLVFPLVFFIFPSLLIVLLGPAVIRVMVTFSGGGPGQ